MLLKVGLLVIIGLLPVISCDNAAKIAKLERLRDTQGIAYVGYKDFIELAMRPDRNFFTITMLTINRDLHRCPTCKKLMKVMQGVQKRLSESGISKPFFVIAVDLENPEFHGKVPAQRVPMMFMRLGQFSVDFDPRFDGTFKEPNVLLWLNKHTGSKFEVKSEEWKFWTAVAALVALLVLAFVFRGLIWRGFIAVLRNFPAVASVLFCIVFSSGLMIVRISKSKMFTLDVEGALTFMTRNSHMQLGGECFIVGGLYLAQTIAFILLTEIRAICKDSKAKRFALTIFGVVLLLWAASSTLSLVKYKQWSYPYSLESYFSSE